MSSKKAKYNFKFLSDEEVDDLKSLNFDQSIQELLAQHCKADEIKKAKKEDPDLINLKEQVKEINSEYKESIGKCNEKIIVVARNLETKVRQQPPVIDV